MRGLQLRRREWSRSDSKQPVVVYQMGKVGSSTVYAAIRDLSGAPAYQVHHLRPEAVADEEMLYRRVFSHRHRIDGHLLDSLFLLSGVVRRHATSPWRFITLVRDPLLRNVSAFFQTLPFRVLEFETWVQDLPADELVERLLDLYRQDGWWHEEPIGRFFEEEFGPVVGIDVLAHPFPREAGARTLKSDTADVLLLRLEDLDRIGAETIARFLGRGPRSVSLQRKQVAGRKYYSGIYRTFRHRITFPRDYLDRIYGSKWARHFYTDHELGRFRSAWKEKA